MDSKIKESKALIRQKQKELTKTTSKREINKINTEIKRIENSMRKRALELERQAYINRYIARKERVIEVNRRKIKATGQLFFIDNKELMLNAKTDDVIKIADKLNRELKPYKKRIENAKNCINKIKKFQNYSDIKGYYEHLQLMEDIKNGDALFPDKLRRKYFGRTFKGVTTYSDTQLIPKEAIPTTKLKEEEKRVEKELAASEPGTKSNIKTEDREESKNDDKDLEKKKDKEKEKEIDKQKISEQIQKETKNQEEKFPNNIYIYRDYSGISIKEIDDNGNISGQNILESISLNWEKENDHFEWYRYKPDFKERIIDLLKKADSLRREADPQIIDAILLESFQTASTDKEIEEAFEKAEYLLEKYNQIVTNPVSKSKVEYNLTNKINTGIYYSSNKRFKTYYDNCLYQAERAKSYATLTNLDGNSKIKRIFRKVKQIITGKEPSEELRVKKVESSRNLLRGLRSYIDYYEENSNNNNNNNQNNKQIKRNKVRIEEIEL